ncbi:MAG TPA: YXWGXW repeat-containing protein [Kofleriaceae bacterium]|nr:YXWGXW repeat-containing protein [Kofleriaceae bacterium]
MSHRRIALCIAASLLGSGCLRGPGAFRLFEAAVVTAVVVSALQPPPPRVVFVPAPRPGYVWQPGYWTRQDDSWVWIDGGWVPDRQNAQYVPSHWEQMQDGSWQLVPAHWVAVAPPPAAY